MQVINTDKSIFCDVDDTLIMYKVPDHLLGETITVSNNGVSMDVLVHTDHVALLKQFKFLGYTVVVWSKTGSAWAKKIVETLGLEPYVDVCMSKPQYYCDDLEGSKVLGERIYKVIL